LGKVDLTPDSPEGETLSEKKTQAEAEHRRLRRQIADDDELKKELEKKFRKSYLLARIFFAGLIAACNVGFYFVCKAKDLGDFLNWNELLLIGFAAYNFICYGSLANFNSLVRYFKNRVENKVYRNYTGLEAKIKQNKVEADRLKKEIEN
jgi:hypothetical protein